MRLPSVSSPLRAVLLAALLAPPGAAPLGACSDPAPDGSPRDDSAPPAAELDPPLADAGIAARPLELARDLDDPRGLALAGGVLYVAERGAGRVIAVAPEGGGRARELVGGLDRPVALAVAGEQLVVAEEGGRVSLVTPAGAVTTLVSDLHAPLEVRVASEVAYVLSAETDAGPGALVAAPLGGGSRVLASDLVAPSGLALAGDRVIVAARAAGPVEGDLFAWPAQTAPSEAAADAGPTLLVAREEVASGLARDEATGALFWGGQKGAGKGARHGFVLRTDGDGGTERLSIAAGGIERVVLAGEYVYFTTAHTLARVPKVGGALEAVAIHTAAGGLVVDGGTVFWTDRAAGKLFRAPRAPLAP